MHACLLITWTTSGTDCNVINNDNNHNKKDSINDNGYIDKFFGNQCR